MKRTESIYQLKDVKLTLDDFKLIKMLGYGA
jgi:hypothetical protein